MSRASVALALVAAVVAGGPTALSTAAEADPTPSTAPPADPTPSTAPPADPTPSTAADATPIASAGAKSCHCNDFAGDLAATTAVWASRGDGVAVPVTPAMRERYRQRIDETYARAGCLSGCTAVPERERNPARALIGYTGFRSTTAGVPKATADERLNGAMTATERCLEVEPDSAACHMWHAAARGLLLRDTWNPLNLTAPRALLAEFRAARAGVPPCEDLQYGAATRGEALLLMRAPAIAGGDLAAARQLMKQASRAPHFNCVVSNRTILAEALARSGDYDGSVAVLEAAVADGLPSCGEQRYENARTFEHAKNCLAHLKARPGVDPGWDNDCE